jgi:hypothetical protein
MDEKKEDIVVPAQAQPVVVKDDFSEIFITEKDTFDIRVRFYKKDYSLVVEGVDDSFDEKHLHNEFSITFKHPDQGDSAKILSQANKLGTGTENIDVRDLVNLEFSRMMCLIRKWSLEKELSNKNILNMHPKIIKAVIVGLRNKLGMDGIF